MQVKLMEEASSFQLLKESVEGRVEYKYSIPNPVSPLPVAANKAIVIDGKAQCSLTLVGLTMWLTQS
jgi:hypothetical protein